MIAMNGGRYPQIKSGHDLWFMNVEVVDLYDIVEE